MLCSVCIPSRGRALRLFGAIESIIKTSEPGKVDVWVRADDDDAVTIQVMTKAIESGWPLTLVIGPRGKGFGEVAGFWNELCELAQGQWQWLLSDDMVVETKGWDAQLERVPIHGYLPIPEIHKLGGSTYKQTEGGPFPMIPKDSLKKYGQMTIPDPPDTGIDQLLRVKHGWKPWVMKGVSVWHHRDDDSELNRHRKL